MTDRPEIAPGFVRDTDNHVWVDQRVDHHEVNDLINHIGRVSRQIDFEMAERCLDTVMTHMDRGVTPAQRLVELMQALAFELNGSGLADRPGELLPDYEPGTYFKECGWQRT